MNPRLLLIGMVCIVIAFIAVKGSRVMGKDVVKEPSAAPATQPTGPLSFTVKDIDGKDYDLSQLKGKVVMFVNVSSKCGLTPQYTALEKAYLTYKDRGFVIVGFPANNFNGQEPGTNEEIKAFCSTKYNVTFPIMAKTSVKGDDQNAVYKFLTEEATNGDFAGEIGWNFTKFLIDRNGQICARFDSKTKPDDEAVTGAIEKGIAAK